MSSLNKVQLIGNLGQNPEVRSFQSGDKVCNLSLATSESWKDKATGERKEKTEWHRVVITNQNIVGVAERYLTKGSKVYLEGKLQTRKYEQGGVEKYTTEIVVGPFDSKLVLLSGKQGDDEPGDGQISQQPATKPALQQSATAKTLDDEIPF